MFEKTKYTFLATLLVLVLLLPLVPVLAEETTDKAGEEERIGGPSPLTHCPVSGGELGSMGDPVIKVYDGREVRFCCAGCIEAFEKDKQKYIEKMDTQLVEMQKDHYPLDTCLVSGGKLGGMGEPVDYIHGNRLLRFCCDGCIEPFLADSDKYLEKLDAAVVEKQKADYPLDTCVISGGKLGGMGEPIDAVYANRLVRFCCAGCISAFEKAPAANFEKIDAAQKNE